MKTKQTKQKRSEGQLFRTLQEVLQFDADKLMRFMSGSAKIFKVSLGELNRHADTWYIPAMDINDAAQIFLEDAFSLPATLLRRATASHYVGVSPTLGYLSFGSLSEVDVRDIRYAVAEMAIAQKKK